MREHLTAKAKKAVRVTALCAAVAMLFPLAGCGDLVPQPQQNASAASSTAPSISLAQEEKIEKKILAVINEADAKRDPNLLKSRVDGPELAIRTSQIEVLKGTNKPDAAMTIPSGVRQRVLPLTTGWPRDIYVITDTTADQQSQRLLVFDQASPHSNYMLWGLVRLFSGVSMPKFPIPSIGAKAGSLDDTGLVATPKQAIEMYAQVLQNPNSKDASKIANDQFRTQLANLTASVQQGVAVNGGSQQQTFTPDIESAKVVRSASGGDLVIAQINSVWTRSAGQGRKSEPASDAEKVLFGNGTTTSTMKVTYVNVVALYVPPASANAKIEAVGAERQPVKVEAVQ